MCLFALSLQGHGFGRAFADRASSEGSVKRSGTPNLGSASEYCRQVTLPIRSPLREAQRMPPSPASADAHAAFFRVCPDSKDLR
jgi:hypothetical protein